MMKLAPRTLALAIGQGILGGAVTAVVLSLMHDLQHAVWHTAGSSRWAIPVVVMIGGVILSVLHRWASDEGVAEQITDAADPVRLHRRRTAFLGLSAIVAVAFGGAIGPEAGLIAVMSEISAIVTVRLARSHAEQRLIGETGTSGSLGALYGAPGGSTMLEHEESDEDGGLRVANIVAGLFGFLSFLVVHRAVSAPSSTLGLHAVHLSTREVLFSGVAALFGALLATGYTLMRKASTAFAGRVPSAPVRIVCGSAIFAVIATCLPQVRFSGHDDFEHLIDLSSRGAWWTLALVAVVKLLATSVNLSSGWLGGDFFPLLLCGGAVGVLACGFLSLPPEAAAIAGMTAAATVGMRKPMAVLVIVVLVNGGVGLPAALVGAAIGSAVASLLPEPAASH